MAKLKKGDMALVKEGHAGDCGSLGSSTHHILITRVDSDGGYYYKGFDKNGKTIGTCCMCYEDKDLTLMKNGKLPKQKPVNFLLKYDLDEYPIEEFETMKEVDDRIQELVADREDNELQLDSIFVYEVKNKSQAIVETRATIELKNIK